MTTLTLDSEFRVALSDTVQALREIVEYDLEPGLARRMRELSEKKETATQKEHAEYLALADFCRRRTSQKVSALKALKRLHDSLPDLVEFPPELAKLK